MSGAWYVVGIDGPAVVILTMPSDTLRSDEDRSDPGRVQMWDQKGTPPGETVWVSPVVHESEGQS